MPNPKINFGNRRSIPLVDTVRPVSATYSTVGTSRWTLVYRVSKISTVASLMANQFRVGKTIQHNGQTLVIENVTANTEFNQHTELTVQAMDVEQVLELLTNPSAPNQPGVVPAASTHDVVPGATTPKAPIRFPTPPGSGVRRIFRA